MQKELEQKSCYEELKEEKWKNIYQLLLNMEFMIFPKDHKNIKDDKLLTEIDGKTSLMIANQFVSEVLKKDLKEELYQNSFHTIPEHEYNIRDIYNLIYTIIPSVPETVTAAQYMLSNVTSVSMENMVRDYLKEKNILPEEAQVVAIERYNILKQWIDSTLMVYDMQKDKDIQPNRFDYYAYRLLLGELLGSRLAHIVREEQSADAFFEFQQSYLENDLTGMMKALDLPVVQLDEDYDVNLQVQLFHDYIGDFTFVKPKVNGKRHFWKRK